MHDHRATTKKHDQYSKNIYLQTKHQKARWNHSEWCRRRRADRSECEWTSEQYTTFPFFTLCSLLWPCWWVTGVGRRLGWASGCKKSQSSNRKMLSFALSTTQEWQKYKLIKQNRSQKFLCLLHLEKFLRSTTRPLMLIPITVLIVHFQSTNLT